MYMISSLFRLSLFGYPRGVDGAPVRDFLRREPERDFPSGALGRIRAVDDVPTDTAHRTSLAAARCLLTGH